MPEMAFIREQKIWEVLEHALRLIVEEYQPEKVILFGSYAGSGQVEVKEAGY